MLPAEFRVVIAALLAIVLGLILGFAKRKSVKNPPPRIQESAP
jgi:hypothetical protein